MQTRQSLMATQAAVKEQSQLLERQRATLSQNAELVQIDRLEEEVSRIQEVCQYAMDQACGFCVALSAHVGCCSSRMCADSASP